MKKQLKKIRMATRKKQWQKPVLNKLGVIATKGGTNLSVEDLDGRFGSAT